MRIRFARPDEYDDVGDLTVGAYAADGYLTPEDDYAAELRGAAHRAADAELVVAVDEQHTGHRHSTTLLGTVTFCLGGSPYAEISRGGEAEFRMLAVEPDSRGRGVGEALARWCVDRAREQGCTGIALSSLDRMHTAHRLYERMGFVRQPERDWRPHPSVALLVYRLSLEA
ncbi:MAG: GNAT family N-acetyltransferase [Actinomycetes bacterium]